MFYDWIWRFVSSNKRNTVAAPSRNKDYMRYYR